MLLQEAEILLGKPYDKESRKTLYFGHIMRKNKTSLTRKETKFPVKEPTRNRMINGDNRHHEKIKHDHKKKTKLKMYVIDKVSNPI